MGLHDDPKPNGGTKPDGAGGLQVFNRLKQAAQNGVNRTLESWHGGKELEDTLRRLLRDGFADLSPAERQERVEQVIQSSALAAMAVGAAPVPFLELPFMAIMVSAIARIHGQKVSGKKAIWQMAGALGGGLFLRQIQKLIPGVGTLAATSRIYGATWALGRVANAYYGTAKPPEEHELKQVFEETMEAKTSEQAHRMEEGEALTELNRLEEAFKSGHLNANDYRRQRKALLERLAAQTGI